MKCVCLFGFNVSFKHLRSYRNDAYLQQCYFDQCAATQECHAANTGHDTPSRHSIQTRGRPVVVLSIDVKRHIGIHNDPFQCLGSDPIEKSSLDLPHTPATAQPYDAVMVVVSRKLGRKYHNYTNRVLNPRPVVFESMTLSACPQLLPFYEIRGSRISNFPCGNFKYGNSTQTTVPLTRYMHRIDRR